MRSLPSASASYPGPPFAGLSCRSASSSAEKLPLSWSLATARSSSGSSSTASVILGVTYVSSVCAYASSAPSGRSPSAACASWITSALHRRPSTRSSSARFTPCSTASSGIMPKGPTSSSGASSSSPGSPPLPSHSAAIPSRWSSPTTPTTARPPACAAAARRASAMHTSRSLITKRSNRSPSYPPGSRPTLSPSGNASRRYSACCLAKVLSSSAALPMRIMRWYVTCLGRSPYTSGAPVASAATYASCSPGSCWAMTPHVGASITDLSPPSSSSFLSWYAARVKLASRGHSEANIISSW
mmetsp:Transcript_24751/g.84680  ORF Transcript_24751/g.84680 Transcript_24751/m.84680 type:complete len:300 (+) Transcript_24751:187-1086(+)